MERQSKGSRGLEAYCNGGQGPPRAVAPLKKKKIYRGADKSVARPTSRCILFDVENISFDASLYIYI